MGKNTLGKALCSTGTSPSEQSSPWHWSWAPLVVWCHMVEQDAERMGGYTHPVPSHC